MLSLRENISDSVFEGLNSTNQVAAQCESLGYSVRRQTVGITWFSTIIETLVSSAGSLMLATMSLAMSLIYRSSLFWVHAVCFYT